MPARSATPQALLWSYQAMGARADPGRESNFRGLAAALSAEFARCDRTGTGACAVQAGKVTVARPVAYRMSGERSAATATFA